MPDFTILICRFCRHAEFISRDDYTIVCRKYPGGVPDHIFAECPLFEEQEQLLVQDKDSTPHNLQCKTFLH